MKEKFSVLVIDNATGKTVQKYPYFSQEEAHAEYDGWMGTGQYGPDQEHTLQILDESAAYNHDLEVQDRSNDRGFGLYIIDLIAAYNKKNFSGAQVQGLFSSPGYMAIILGLLTGALESTRQAIAAVGPSLYPQEFVDQVLSAIDLQIASHESQEETPSEQPSEGSSSEPV